MQETQVRFLSWEDLLEEGMAIHSILFLSRESHGQGSLEGYSPYDHKEMDMTGVTECACTLYSVIKKNE